MDDVFKISKDIPRAKSLFEISKERLEIIKVLPRDKTYKIIEDYYEIVLELLTSVMYADGFKTLSHISVIDYFFKNYKILSPNQFNIIDTMRKYRNSIVYYGKKISADYLTNNEGEIKKIIFKLQVFVGKKLS